MVELGLLPVVAVLLDPNGLEENFSDELNYLPENETEKIIKEFFDDKGFRIP